MILPNSGEVKKNWWLLLTMAGTSVFIRIDPTILVLTDLIIFSNLSDRILRLCTLDDLINIRVEALCSSNG